MKKVCKYCHLDGHLIDECPTIICKICKEIGHAQWQCPQKNKKKNTSSNDLTVNIPNNYNYSIEKNVIVPKTLEYYNKLLNKEWGDLI
jgi:hypothetical protein